MNEDIVTVHDAIMGPFIATAVSKLFSSSLSGCIKKPLRCFHALPWRVLTAMLQEREEEKPFQYF